MTPTTQAATALSAAGIPAATDAQVTRCIELAAWLTADPISRVALDGEDVFAVAAREVFLTMGGPPIEIKE